MAMDLRQCVNTTTAKEDIERRRTDIFQSTLRRSLCLDEPNFTRFRESDVKTMFDLYDQTCFDGLCRRQLDSVPLHFRISKRMTSSGGKTTRTVARYRNRRVCVEYEIAVSGTLLFQNFKQSGRPITVTGIPCENRLQALQRIMEHEIIHLIELMLWEDSNCGAERFRSMAQNLFGHTEHGHRLITPRESAFTRYGIRTGDRVTFQFEGRRYEGFVNRITKRATVLVEDVQGQSYSDGKCYKKYYVPVNLLRRCG